MAYQGRGYIPNIGGFSKGREKNDVMGGELILLE